MLTHWSVAQAGSNDKKTGGRKSRWTVPLRVGFIICSDISTLLHNDPAVHQDHCRNSCRECPALLKCVSIQDCLCIMRSKQMLYQKNKTIGSFLARKRRAKTTINPLPTFTVVSEECLKFWQQLTKHSHLSSVGLHTK